MVLPALVADHPEGLHVAGLQYAAELSPVTGGLELGICLESAQNKKH
jgi:hypothetical protein